MADNGTGHAFLCQPQTGVILAGNSGTGKNHIAKALHRYPIFNALKNKHVNNSYLCFKINRSGTTSSYFLLRDMFFYPSGCR